MSARVKQSIQLVVSAMLLGILIYWIDLDKVKSSLLNANFFFLALAFLIQTVNRIIMSVKWNLLLRVKGIKVSWLQITRIYYIANFLGLYLPPTVGMDFVRTYYVSKKKHSMTDIISSIFVERLIGLLVLLIFAITGIFLFLAMVSASELPAVQLLWILISLTVIGVAAFFFSLNNLVSEFILGTLKSIEKSRFGKISQKLQKLYASYLNYKSEKLVLTVFFFLTIFEVVTYIMRSYLVARGLHVDLPFIYFIAFVPIIMAVIRLPISINGFGINEGGFVYFLFLLGIPKTIGFSVGLIDHFVNLLVVLPGGIFYAFDQLVKKVGVRNPPSLEDFTG